ncbi:hypothetical protein ACKFKF_18370 [Phormidesmis sp. 146-12]
MCYSDSLITTLGANSQQTGTGSFLPSNAEIKHQTARGIKIQIVSATAYGKSDVRRDFVFSIAGAVPLGLQSLIHLDSVFKTFLANYRFEDYLKRVEGTLREFWQDAWDKDIEYLVTAADDGGEIRIIYMRGTESDLIIEEIEAEDGLLFAVIGDRAEEAYDMIRRETNSLMCAGMEIDSALHLACLRMMRRAIEDPNQIFVGGSIQSCQVWGRKAAYITLDDGNQLMYRGVKYSREWNRSIDMAPFPVAYISADMYNPQVSI